MVWSGSSRPVPMGWYQDPHFPLSHCMPRSESGRFDLNENAQAALLAWRDPSAGSELVAASDKRRRFASYVLASLLPWKENCHHFPCLG